MATQFALKDPNPGAWFSFDDEDENAGRIRVRVLNDAQRTEIRKQVDTKRVEYKHGQRFPVVDRNEDLYSRLLWDHAIVEWEGLEDEEGNPIECTTENKVKLMQENIGFALFVGQCMERVIEDQAKLLKDAEGN